MVEDLNTVEPPEQPGPAELANARRQQFRQANASLALEGLQPGGGDKAVQELVARGELSPDEAVAQYLRQAAAGTL